MSGSKALIAGATGAIGSPLAYRLASDPDWQVVGLSRRPPVQPAARVAYVQGDMMDVDAAAKAIAAHADITHLFYCGRAPHDDKARENVAGNLAILDAVVRATERVSSKLRHVHLVQGGKYYGVHFGPFPTPAREDDPRAVVDNFYYAQEDYLRERSKGGRWGWSASRPTTLLHFSPTNARNLVSTLGAYAAICREVGAALDFPGPEGSYTSLSQYTSTDLLSNAMAWMARDEKAANNAFNIANGDLMRWSRTWPRLAAAFGMSLGSVRPVTLADVMADKEAVWTSIMKRHGLEPRPLSAVAHWAYADMTLMRWWDEYQLTNKARAFGFHDWRDSEDEFLSILERYRQARILP
jgi:nucleoside-diphosphate-sugar epimerase